MINRQDYQKLLNEKKIEFYSENNKIYEIDTEFNKLVSSNIYYDIGMAVRTINDDRLGFSYTTNFSKGCIDKLINESIMFSGMTKKIKDYDFPYDDNVKSIEGIYDDNVQNLDRDILVKDAVEMIKDVSVENKIKFEKFVFTVESRNRHILNSNGLDFKYKESLIGTEFLFSKNKMFTSRMFTYRNLDVDRIKNDIQNIETFRHRKLKHIKIDKSKQNGVIFHPYSLSIILSCMMSGGVSAESVYKKESFINLDDCELEGVTLIDDGTISGGLNSRPIDGDGFQVKKTIIIENGRFVRPICNNYWSKIAGYENTSNSSRSSYRSAPFLSSTNLIFDMNKKGSLDEIFNLNKEEIYILNLFPDFSKFNTKGDFLFHVMESYYVKNGEIEAAVKPFLLFGNIVNTINSIRLSSKKSFNWLGVTCPYINVDIGCLNVENIPEIPKKEMLIIFLKRLLSLFNRT